MTDKSEPQHHCQFDPNYPCGNLQGYEELIEDETCDHIRKALPKASDYELYVVMDSNCHKPHPADPCIKPESSDVRLILKWTKSRNMNKPRRVSCFLTSYKPNLLRFRDGVVENECSVLDLKRDAFVLMPIYKKKPNCRHITVQVEKIPDFELRHAPMSVQVFLWKDYPNNSGPAQNAYMEVKIPKAADGPLFLTEKCFDQKLNPPPTRALELSKDEMVEALSSLLSASFDALLYKTGIPQDVLPSNNAPQRTRAIEVVKWIENQGDEVRHLILQELWQVVPEAFRDRK